MEKIRNIQKIVSVGRDELQPYELSLSYSEPWVGKVAADLLVYSYEDDGYGGSGVAAWRYKGKWSYQYLGHCSCNGPTEDMRTSDSAKFTLEELKTILSSKDNAWNENYALVVRHLDKLKS